MCLLGPAPPRVPDLTASPFHSRSLCNLEDDIWDRPSEHLLPVMAGAELSSPRQDATEGPKRHPMGCYFGPYHVTTRNPGLPKISTIKRPTEGKKKGFWLWTQRFNVLRASGTRRSPKTFTIKWWHLSRLKSYNSIHILLWRWKWKLHLLDIDLKTSIFKVTTVQFSVAEPCIRGNFMVVPSQRIVGRCAHDPSLRGQAAWLHPSSATSRRVTRAKVPT